ncbi:MAG: hypothetical protein WCT12_03210 [Verrucomicrobiota bacterium]|jgi:hypothetical protein
MNPDDFETRLQGQPLRRPPVEWRAEILAAAGQASSPQPATRNPQPAIPLRSRLSALNTLNHFLSRILWPHPVAWTGLAAVWLVILGINLTTRDASRLVTKRASPVSPQLLMAFHEQERLLAELIGPPETPATEQPKPRPPRPRSERRREMLMT